MRRKWYQDASSLGILEERIPMIAGFVPFLGSRSFLQSEARYKHEKKGQEEST